MRKKRRRRRRGRREYRKRDTCRSVPLWISDTWGGMGGSWMLTVGGGRLDEGPNHRLLVAVCVCFSPKSQETLQIKTTKNEHLFQSCLQDACRNVNVCLFIPDLIIHPPTACCCPPLDGDQQKNHHGGIKKNTCTFKSLQRKWDFFQMYSLLRFLFWETLEIIKSKYDDVIFLCRRWKRGSRRGREEPALHLLSFECENCSEAYDVSVTVYRSFRVHVSP